VASSGLFSEGTSQHKTQTSGRFAVLPVRPFAQQWPHPPSTPSKADLAAAARQREGWQSLVLAMETALRPFDHEPGTLVAHWDYLPDRTRGVIASLTALILTAAIMAIEDAIEKITKSLLDSIESGWTAQRAYEARQGPSRKGKPPATPG
jgi:hypothetical protein